MTMDKYPEITFAVQNKFKKLIIDNLRPWEFFNATKKLIVMDFYGRQIQYSGVAFEGSPREVFWGGFIEPFLEDIFIWSFDFALKYANERKLNGRDLILYTHQCLLNGVSLTYNRMQNIDRKLRGKGFPNQVSPRDVSREINRINMKLDEYRGSTIAGLEGDIMGIDNCKEVNMTSNEALGVASEFQKYLRSGDKSSIERYAKEEIKCALSLIPHSKSHHYWYKEMESRVKELEKVQSVNKTTICNAHNCRFYSKWWFKLLLAPFIVALFGGLILLYFQNKSSNNQNNSPQSLAINDIKNSGIVGDIVGRDKIIYQSANPEPVNQINMERQNNFKISKVKINRIIEDLSLGISEIKKEYFKGSERIVNDFNSRNILTSGMHIKAQMDFAISVKEQAGKLMIKARRDIEDVLLGDFNITSLAEKEEFKEDNARMLEIEKVSIPEFYKRLEEAVRSQEVRSLGRVNITKDFKL